MEENAITIKNLSVSYEDNSALENVNLEIRNGEFTAIVGPNGGGKTTLLKAILKLIAIDEGSIDLHNDKISYVPQITSLDKSFPITVFETVMQGTFQKENIRPFFKYGKKNNKLAKEALEMVDITHLSKKMLSELSGGEFQKVMVARSIASQAKILVLDEPTANIDQQSRCSIYEILNKLKGNTTILMATHDLFAVSQSVDRIICVDKGIVYHGEPALGEDIVNQMYGCPVDLIAHGVPHRVMPMHKEKEDK